MNSVEAILFRLRHRGLILSAEEGHIRVCPSSHLSAEDRIALLDNRQGVLSTLQEEEQEITRRVESMRRQLPSAGAIPFLTVRDGLPEERGACGSCGGAATGRGHYRCHLCAEAARRVLRCRSPPERRLTQFPMT